MKKIIVHTYYYPATDNDSELYLAYTTYQGARTDHLIDYEIEAKNGTEAKKLAIKMRKEHERNKGR